MLVNSVLLALLPGFAVAANDWSKPCTSGTCSYESGDGKNTAWSNLVINAVSTDALSDITPASGWEILNCDSKSTDPQDIRLVCVDKTKGCSHLFNGGAEDTIVRLPEDCTGGPFARVVKTWIDKDQSLPARLAKRGQRSRKVRGLALDFDFSKIPESRGNVYITVAATNSPAQRDAIRPAVVKRSIQPIRHANRRAQAAAVVRDFTSAPIKRSPISFGNFFSGVKDRFNDAVHTVVDGAGKAADAVANGAQKAVDAVKNPSNGASGNVGSIVDSATGAVEGFVGAVGNGTNFDQTFNKAFDAININKNFPIFDQSISCPQKGIVPEFGAGLKMDVDVAAKLTANVGFIVTGSIAPPNIDKLAFTGGLTGDVSATFNVGANAKGTFQIPDVKLFEVGLPGLNFPGILSVGPSFSINANAKAELGIVADISVTASLALPEVQFTFPASEGKSFAKVHPKDAPIKLTVGTSNTLTGRAEAHLIPRLDIGVEILNGAAKATVFANVDASAGLDFVLDAKAISTPVDGTIGNPNVDFKNIGTSFGGSVAMDLGVAINVGAEAALKPFFDQNANFQVFQKTFPLFEKKFGDQVRKRSVLTLGDGRLSKRSLVCPGAGEGAPSNSVVDAIGKFTT